VQSLGPQVAAVRSLSAWISLLVFPRVYWLCWELFRSASVGWIAVTIVAVRPFHINSGCAGMISNLPFIVGRKVESSCEQIIRAIFIFLTHSQQSTVNKHGRCNRNRYHVLYAQEARPYMMFVVLILVSNAILLLAIALQKSTARFKSPSKWSKAVWSIYAIVLSLGLYYIAVLKKVRYALCPMPYALCPMPYALCRIVPHMRARKAIVYYFFSSIRPRHLCK